MAKKKDKRTINDLQSTSKIEQHDPSPPPTSGVNFFDVFAVVSY
jgi:hypothetical protein